MILSFTRLVARMLVIGAVAAPVASVAAEADYPLDQFPVATLNDQAALQRGAKLFVNNCLSCHSASAMRYNRLVDIGLTEDQIKANLLFTADKVGDPMNIAMRPADAKTWFGAAPPDLSLIARARASHAGTGADWLYTYLRSYYRDDTTAIGWNNAVFPNVGMPNVLWKLQGMRGATIEEVKADGSQGFIRTVTRIDDTGRATVETTPIEGGHPHESRTVRLEPAQGGEQSRAEFDETVVDLVAYITYMSDPTARKRVQLGVWVLLYLSLLFVAAWVLNKAYWKDIR